ncbi:hypothetical protein [Streptomyces sp. H27-C3]|uniref:hypothetical protein n=1 Tax=Streptomyces sp. H27-C3 TaxID=3046305 RepID=UPI0024BAFB16|nr:hypothetical protein [Streptomyces sp. H27-C3]MDJ0460456.1 hypothetical protein [Streptomyces sp. H27-C3]
MHGSGAAPPARNDGAVIGLRVLFTLCGALSCGLLSCVPLFRIAILRGRGLDWVLAWGSLPLSFAALGVVGSLPEKDPRTDVAVVFVLLLGMASAAYFLVFDIRHHKRARALGAPDPYGPYSNTVPQYGSYPNQMPNQVRNSAPNQLPNQTPNPGPPPNPYANTPAPGPSYGYPATPPPQQQPQQQRPQQPQRLDQVRAELDELSDYLRRDSGSGNSGGGSGGGSRDGEGR